MTVSYREQRDLKLHLGCGQDYWPGYVNIDLDPSAKADLYLSALELETVFAPGSVDEIVMYHVINYLSLWEARRFFAAAMRLLSPRGRLVIETVNLEAALGQIQVQRGNLDAYLEGVRALHAFGRDHMQAQAEFVPNKFSWTPWHLETELKAAGFGRVRQTEAQSHAGWRDMRLEADVSAAPQVTGKPGQRVLFLLYYPMGSVTMHIRGLIFEGWLKQLGWQVTYLDVARTPIDDIIQTAAQHDLVYALKVPFLELYLRLKAETQAKVIFDLTDALWQPHHRDTGWQQLEMILAVVDGIFSDNPYVAAYGQRFNPNVKVIYACTQVERFLEARQNRPERNDGQLRIGWVGTHGTLQALYQIAGPLARLCQRFPNLELRVLCLNYRNAKPLDLPGVRYTVVPDYDENLMIQEVLDFDVGVFPAPFDLDDYAIRGPLKTLIYMSGARATVSEAAGMCLELVDDGVNGMLARSEAEWEEKLAILLGDADLRQRMGKSALELVLHRDSLEAVSRSLHEALVDLRDHALPNPAAALLQQTLQPATEAVDVQADDGRPVMLLACDFFWPSIGGVETIVANLGEALQKLGYRVEVAARALPNRHSNQYRGMLIHSLDAGSRLPDGSIHASQQLRSLIETGRYRGVIMRADPLNWVIWGLSGIQLPPHTRVLVQPLINNDGFNSWKDNIGFRQSLKQTMSTAQVVCLTQVGPDKRYLDEEQVPYVHLPNASTPATPDVDFRASLGLDAQTPLLIQVANLWPVKNHLALLATLRAAPGDWQLVLLGHPSGHADYVEQVRAAVKLDPRVRLIEGVPAERVAAAMQAADLLLLPSLGEVSPVTIIEAMSHGLPWLATPECGAANEASGGFIAPVSQFPDLIARLLADPELRRTLSELGRQHWQACNQWEVVARGWRDLVEHGELREPPQAPAAVKSRMVQLRQRLERPLISVVIPTRNRPHLLGNALECLTHQTFKQFEVIIVNDGGCNIEDLLAYYGNKLAIVYVRNPASLGPSGARNRALQLARGDIISYLDDDDVYLSSHLQVVRDAFADFKGDFVYTDAEYLIQRTEEGRIKELAREHPFDKVVYSRDQLLVRNFIPTPTWAHRRALIERIGPFDESLDFLEDWDFLLRASALGEFRHIAKQTVEVRSDEARSDHTLRKNRGRFLEMHSRIYQKHPTDDPLLLRRRALFLSQLGGEAVSAAESTEAEHYRNWLARRSLQEVDAQLHAERLVLQWPKRIQVTLLMVVRSCDHALLADTIDSLREQLYPDWRLVVLADTPSPDSIFDETEMLGWLELETLEDPDLLARACNQVLEALPSDWVARVPAGTRLTAHGLLQLGDYLLQHPERYLVYTDHDDVSPEGLRSNPVLKPDFNLDMLRSQDYVGEAVFFRTDVVLGAGGFAAYPGAEHAELALRLLDQQGEAGFGHLAELVFSLPERRGVHPLRDAALQAAVEDHLLRRHVAGTVVTGYLPGTLRVSYAHDAQPWVSVLIPNRDQMAFLEPCVESLLTKTDYAQFELVIVDNQSEEPETLAYYQRLQTRLGDRFRLVRYDAPFNFAIQCNLGVEAAKGEYILLLNNDTEVMHPEWLTRMMQYAQRPEVGAVGARLCYPETAKIQHAGVVLGLGLGNDAANHIFLEQEVDAPGYLNRLQVDQNYTALTAACLLVRRSVYQAVGGMDGDAFATLYNDVDLCLKIDQQGYKQVWTPYATLVHHGSKSLNAVPDPSRHWKKLAQLQAERDTMLSRWMARLRHDPVFNRHLSLVYNGDMQYDSRFPLCWEPGLHDRPRMLGLPLSGGSGEYRIRMPFRGVRKAGLAQAEYYQLTQHPLPSVVELARLAPDTLVIQNAMSDEHENALKLYQQHVPDVLRVQMLDDLLSDIPEQSSMHQHFQRHWRDARSRLRRTLRHCDRLVVTTEPLRAFAADMIEDIRVVPNRLEKEVWLPLQSQRRAGRKPRVGWVGAQQHAGDLALITDVVRATAGEVEWVFMGMCPENIRPFVAEYHLEWIPYEQYPAHMAALNLDLAVAPLEVNAFNEAKSNLRLLEYGVLGWPVICTDILPYQTNAAPVCRVPNQAQAWIDAIRARIHDLDAAAAEGDRLQAWVRQHYLLEDHLDEWMQALVR